MTQSSDTELLAPAGSFDAALAAYQYGADAVYLGLSKHSARAEAVNFTPEQLLSISSYAHSLPKRRAVYVAINTLVRDDELEGVLESLDAADQAEVDGIILQDFAVFSLLKKFFPKLKAHASTQMAIHNREGAQALAELGFSRVVLARELSFDEIRVITSKVPIETEVFIHGALCYGYSGECLFSALRTGRSGNRGRCAYCCRSEFHKCGDDESKGFFPFSMKDLFLYDSVRDMRDAGVASLKIEGRMKSPLYVAAVTDLYRRKLDGELEDADAASAAISDMQTVFSRPVTRLHFDGNAPSRDVIDETAVGHRGAFIGRVQAVRRDKSGERFLRFAPQRPLEVHDGLQIEFQQNSKTLHGGRPFGFSIESMRIAGNTHPSFTVPSRSRIEIALPKDAPIIPEGAAIYCSSSQEVHRKYAFTTPRSTELRSAKKVSCEIELSACAISAKLTDKETGISASAYRECALTPAQKPELTYSAVEKAMGRLGDTNWVLADLKLTDRSSLYAPASILNDVRRIVCTALDEKVLSHNAELRHNRLEYLKDLQSTKIECRKHTIPRNSLKILFGSQGTSNYDVDEVIILLTHDAYGDVASTLGVLDSWGKRASSIRLALPTFMRGQEVDNFEKLVRKLIDSGYRKWECADISGLHILKRLGGNSLSITADGSFYAFNQLSALKLKELGVEAAVAPAECDIEQLISMGVYASDWIIIPLRQRPPMFISETRPVTPGISDSARHFELEDRRGWTCTVDEHDGRWYTRDSKPIDRTPYLADFRAAGFTHFRYDFFILF